MPRKATLGGGALLAVLVAGIVAGCTVDPAPLTPAEERQRQQNLREVRGSTSQFNTDVGNPQGFGEIPPGR